MKSFWLTEIWFGLKLFLLMWNGYCGDNLKKERIIFDGKPSKLLLVISICLVVCEYDYIYSSITRTYLVTPQNFFLGFREQRRRGLYMIRRLRDKDSLSGGIWWSKITFINIISFLSFNNIFQRFKKKSYVLNDTWSHFSSTQNSKLSLGEALIYNLFERKLHVCSVYI